MEKVEGGVRGQATLPQAQQISSGVRLWQAIEQTLATATPQKGSLLLNERRQIILRTYLTTDITQKELTSLAGLKSDSGVNYHLQTSMKIVFPHLPENIQRDFETPDKALRTRSGTFTTRSRRHVRQALDRLK